MSCRDQEITDGRQLHPQEHIADCLHDKGAGEQHNADAHHLLQVGNGIGGYVQHGIKVEGVDSSYQDGSGWYHDGKHQDKGGGNRFLGMLPVFMCDIGTQLVSESVAQSDVKVLYPKQDAADGKPDTILVFSQALQRQRHQD